MGRGPRRSAGTSAQDTKIGGAVGFGYVVFRWWGASAGAGPPGVEGQDPELRRRTRPQPANGWREGAMARENDEPLIGAGSLLTGGGSVARVADGILPGMPDALARPDRRGRCLPL